LQTCTISELAQDAELAERAKLVKSEEIAAIEAADATIVHSAVEKKVLATAAAGANVQVVPWAYTSALMVSPASQRSGVIFVGGYRHTPNVDAAKWLVTEIMPLVWEEMPDIICTLVGSNMPDEVKALASARIETLGYVPSTAEIYRKRLLAVAPLRYGAGVKGKVLEAFAAGVPCIMTTIAAEGILLPEKIRDLVAESPEEIATMIVRLHRLPERASAFGGFGRKMIFDEYSEGAVDKALSRFI